MARLTAHGNQVVLRLNWLEKLADLRLGDVRVPKSSVESVEVIDNPHADLIPREIDLGFAGNTAPGRKIMTVKTRAKRLDGARAALVVYANRSAVVIRLAANETPWRLIIVSNKNAGSVAGSVGESVGL